MRRNRRRFCFGFLSCCGVDVAMSTPGLTVVDTVDSDGDDDDYGYLIDLGKFVDALP